MCPHNVSTFARALSLNTLTPLLNGILSGAIIVVIFVIYSPFFFFRISYGDIFLPAKMKKQVDLLTDRETWLGGSNTCLRASSAIEISH